MAQELGRLLLIQRSDGGTPASYTNICGFRARSFSINNNLVDVSVPDCVNPENPVDETMAAGLRSIQFTGSGLFDNDAAGQAVADDAFDQTVDQAYKVIVPGYAEYTGNFIIENFSWNGDVEGNLEFEATFRASGPITKTAL